MSLPCAPKSTASKIPHSEFRLPTQPNAPSSSSRHKYFMLIVFLICYYYYFLNIIQRIATSNNSHRRFQDKFTWNRNKNDRLTKVKRNFLGKLQFYQSYQRTVVIRSAYKSFHLTQIILITLSRAYSYIMFEKICQIIIIIKKKSN